MPVRSYRDLHVWQKAFALAQECHTIVRSMPPRRMAGLANQLERAAVSIPANIAEGNGRNHRGEYLHHLSIAHGSLSEVESHLRLLEAVGCADANMVSGAIGQCREVGRMLNGLVRALRETRNVKR